MKKLITAFIATFLLNSCQVPFKIETLNGSFGRNADGSLFLGYSPKKPVIIDGK
jgi:hypothetical protein